MLPKRREPVRSGITRAPKRAWPRHRRYVRSFVCCVEEREGAVCIGQVEFSHIRTAANAGTGIKPHDSNGVPMCSSHHRYYHNVGHRSFEACFAIDLAKLADELTRSSPDTQMRAAMKEAGIV